MYKPVMSRYCFILEVVRIGFWIREEEFSDGEENRVCGIWDDLGQTPKDTATKKTHFLLDST